MRQQGRENHRNKRKHKEAMEEENNINKLHSLEREEVIKRIYSSTGINRKKQSIHPEQLLGHQKLAADEIEAMVDRLSKQRQTKKKAEVNRKAKVEPTSYKTISEQETLIQDTVKRLTEDNTKYVTDSHRSGKEFYEKAGIFSTYCAAGAEQFQ